MRTMQAYLVPAAGILVFGVALVANLLFGWGAQAALSIGVLAASIALIAGAAVGGVVINVPFVGHHHHHHNVLLGGHGH